MEGPFEFSTRGLPDEEAHFARALAEEELARLVRVAPELIACRVAVDAATAHSTPNSDLRVRVEVTLPPRKDLVAVVSPREDNNVADLRQAVTHAFRSLLRQVKRTRERRRGDVKAKQSEQPLATVVELFPDQGFGFLRSIEDGHQIYFHRNSVIGADFDRVSVGTQVRYVETEGEQGPQASTVHIEDKPGVRRPQPPA